jgi:hypothetical protein
MHPLACGSAKLQHRLKQLFCMTVPFSLDYFALWWLRSTASVCFFGDATCLAVLHLYFCRFVTVTTENRSAIINNTFHGLFVF